MTISKLLNYQNFYIDYKATIKEAIAQMNLNSNGSVVLLNANIPVAILTQKDIIKFINEKMDLNISAYSIATTSVIVVNKNESIEFAFSFFTKHNIKRIIVVNDLNKFVGVVLKESLLDYMGKKQQDSLLLQQTKFTLMQEIIGHIAHQWKQPLAQLGGIFMNLDAAYEFDKLDQSYLKNKVKNGNELIKDISNNIEDFQKRFISNNEKEIFEVSKYIKNTNNIIHSTLIYHHIQVEILTPEVPLYVFGFANDFSLVILNILNNSKDAFIKKNIEKPKITIKSNINKDYALITITDNAGRVKKNILNKIFEIHFSTKLKDEVSGLGLYVSKLIIENKFLGNIDAQNTSDGLKVTIKIKVN